MSAATYAALQEAIEAHVADTLELDVLIVKDWVLVGAMSELEDTEGHEQIFVHRSLHTSLYAVTGLLQWGAETMTPGEFLE